MTILMQRVTLILLYTFLLFLVLMNSSAKSQIKFQDEDNSPLTYDNIAFASGVWTGSFECRRRNYNVKLIMPLQQVGAVARLEYSWNASGERGSGTLDLDASTNRLKTLNILSGEKYHPFDTIKILNRAEPTFSSAGCKGVLSLSRVAGTILTPEFGGVDQEKQNNTGDVSSKTPVNGSFYRAGTQTELCDALGTWASRLQIDFATDISRSKRIEPAILWRL